MKIYLAARYSRGPEMQRYADDLNKLGHEVTSRWITGSHALDSQLSPIEQAEEQDRMAWEDFADLDKADCVISFTEPPREPSSSRGGRHVEFGIALARSKRLIVVGHRENVFHWLHMVEFYSEWLELLRKLYIEAGELV